MNRQAILDIIVAHAREILPELADHVFRPEDALRDLGANSIDRSEIVMLTLESLSLQVPLVQLASAANVGELAERLAGIMAARKAGEVA
jgi:polyketide biosynthesis acyl carrier protein